MTHTIRNPTFWLGIAVAVLLWAQYDSAYQGRLDIWRANMHYCETVTQPGALDAASRERDLNDLNGDLGFFASAASGRRKQEGGAANAEVARDYARVVTSSVTRAGRAKDRLARAQERAEIPCIHRFPRPVRNLPLVGSSVG